MLIRINSSALKETRWYQFGLRFLLGGAISAIAGIIAKIAGPKVGGLFLAFPAILPASATLIESHVRQERRKKGVEGATRARKVAGVDAIGAAMGSIGALCVRIVGLALPPQPTRSFGSYYCDALVVQRFDIDLECAATSSRVVVLPLNGASHEA